MQPPSTLLTRLNLATRQLHAEADESWLELVRPTAGLADYLAQLVRTYGFVAPFESACKYTPGLSRVVDFRLVSRAGLIAQDLLALGLSASQVAGIPQCHSLTTFKDTPEAFGWLYVVERSTLLQDGIRRHLLVRLPELERACAYLRAFEGRVGDHWNAFGRTLDRVGAKPEVASEIVAAAKAGFSCVGQWYRGNRSDQRRSAG